MTRAVQTNLKQRINSALNNDQNGFTRTCLSATVTRVSNFVEENVCVCGVFLHRQGSPSQRIKSLNHQCPTQQYVNRNALSMF